MDIQITPESKFKAGQVYETTHGRVKVVNTGDGSLGPLVGYKICGRGSEVTYSVLESYFASIING